MAHDCLIADARAGSDAALDKLIELLADCLWTELGGKRRPRGLGPSHSLSDLVQDTLLRVREKFDRFERDTFTDFKQWARTILHRRRQEWARNFRARNRDDHKQAIGMALRARLSANGCSVRQDELAEHGEEVNRAYAAFKRLKPNEQFIINLRVLEGLRYPQIEALTGLSREAARTSYRRAIERLKKHFESDVKL